MKKYTEVVVLLIAVVIIAYISLYKLCDKTIFWQGIIDLVIAIIGIYLGANIAFSHTIIHMRKEAKMNRIEKTRDIISEMQIKFIALLKNIHNDTISILKRDESEYYVDKIDEEYEKIFAEYLTHKTTFEKEETINKYIEDFTISLSNIRSVITLLYKYNRTEKKDDEHIYEILDEINLRQNRIWGAKFELDNAINKVLGR